MEWVEGLQKLLLESKMRAYFQIEIKIENFRRRTFKIINFV